MRWRPSTRTAAGKHVDEDAFTQTVKRRRAGAATWRTATYLQKDPDPRSLALYIDFPDNWQASDKRPAIVWFFGGAWNTGTPYAFKSKADYFAKRGVVSVRSGLPHPHG